MSEAKFYVGQRVVAMSQTAAGFNRKVITKGEVLTVRKCYGVCMFFNEIVNPSDASSFPASDNYEPAYHTKHFAPVHEDFKAITFEKVIEQELSSVN